MLSKTQLAAKCHKRTMSSRKKRRGKFARLAGASSESRARRLKAISAANESRRQVQESRRPNPAIPKPAPRGLLGRIGSFFRRRTP